jgi:hypothetical protein
MNCCPQVVDQISESRHAKRYGVNEMGGSDVRDT